MSVCFIEYLPSCLRVLQAEVEETLKRIEAHKGVIGTIVVNAEGKPVLCC